jgi:hypothetical protein
MRTELILENKVEQYRAYLHEPYWEMHEAAYLLSGCVAFEGFYNIPPDQRIAIGRDQFGLMPEGALDSSVESFHKLKALNKGHDAFMSLLRIAIEEQGVQILHHKVEFMSWRMKMESHPSFNNHTTFLSPEDALAIAVTEGMILPHELQVASGLYQLPRQRLTKPMEKLIKRLAVAQVYWHRSEKPSIEEVCRAMSGLRKYPQYEFLRRYDNGRANSHFKREREDVKLLKAIGTAYCIPDVYVRTNDRVLFEFIPK